MVRGLCTELCGAGVHSLEHRAYAERTANLTYGTLSSSARALDATQICDLNVRQTVTLCLQQEWTSQRRSISNLLRDLVHELDLVQEPAVNLGGLIHLLNGCSSTQSLLGLNQTALGWALDLLKQLIQLGARRNRTVPVEVGASFVNRTKRLAQCLGEVTSQGHCFSNRLHGGGQRVICSWELLKRETRNLNNHVVDGWLKRSRSGTGDVVLDLIQGVADSHLRSDLGNWVTSSLRSQRRGTRHTWVHLNNDDSAGLWVHRVLDVTATGVHTNFADYGNTDVAQLLVFAVSESQRWSNSDRVTGVHTNWVNVLNGTNDCNVVVLVAHEFQLVLFPTQD